MAEPIEISIGLWTPVGPKNNLLDRGPDHAWEWVILRVKWRPSIDYRKYCPPCAAAMWPFVTLL